LKKDKDDRNPVLTMEKYKEKRFEITVSWKRCKKIIEKVLLFIKIGVYFISTYF